MLTCTHNERDGKTGLCPTCRAEYAEDPSAFIEYGAHPQGEANWRALQEEIAADNAASGPVPPDAWVDVPF